MNDTPPKQVLMTVHNLLRRGNKTQAASLLRQLYEDYPDSSDVLYLMVFLADDPLRILNLCQKILRLDPTHAPTLKLLKQMNARNRAEPPSSVPRVEPLAEPGSILAEDEPYFTRIKRPKRLRRILLLLLAIALVVLAAVLIQPAAIARLLSSVIQSNTAEGRPGTPSVIAAQSSPAPTATPDSFIREATLPATPAARNTPTATTTRSTRPASTPAVVNAPTVLNAPVQPLPGHIKDVGYSVSLKRFVAVADVPPVMFSYEFPTQRLLRIDLPREPLRLALSTDGRTALITHHGLISYVDLTTLAVLRTLQLPQVVHDLALAADGWGYLLIGFNTEQLALLSVNFQTGESHLDPVESPITRPGVMRLTPGADRLYFAPLAANNDATLQAIAIRGGKPDRRLVLPASGTPPSGCEAIWLPDDGARIFTACGSVLSPALDPIGALDGVTSAAGVELLPRSQLIVALAQFETAGAAGGRIPVTVRQFAEIGLFDGATLRQLSRRVLPSFPGDSAPAIGRRLLIDPDTGQLLVLVERPQADSTRSNEWGLVAVTVDAASASFSPVQALKLGMDNTADVASKVAASDVTVLNIQPVDAAYSKALDRLIFAINQPASLQIYDPATQRGIDVPLTGAPTALALSPDGLLAAVAEGSSITLVDLGTRRVLRAFSVDQPVTQIAFTVDGWIVTPRVLIDTATGAQVDGPGGDRVKVSADGRSVYFNTSVARAFGTGKLTRGKAAGAWQEDTAFAPGEDQGVLRTCDDFWLTDDDVWIVTACGEIWQQAASPQYYTALDSIDHIGAFAHSRTANVFVATSSDPSLTVYDSGTFKVRERILLPALTVGVDARPVRGWRVFFSADGTVMTVLLISVDNAAQPVFGLLMRQINR